MHKRRVLLSNLLGGLSRISWTEGLLSTLATFIAIIVVGVVSTQFISGPSAPLLVASMGAAAVLVFAVSHSPFAQPWPVLGGHVVSAFIGVACAQTIPIATLAAALAVALALLFMLVFRCLHPPGGAAALLPVLANESVHELGFFFVLAPVLLNAAILVAMGFVLNRWLLHRVYPSPALPTRDERHKHADPRPLDRLGLRRDDLLHALKTLDTYIDVTEADLDEIYRIAGMHAYRRNMGDLRCTDIMSRDVRTVTGDTEVEEAWARLRHHKVAVLPVIDQARRVIGTVSLVDILKRADLRTYAGFEEKLRRFMQRTKDRMTDQPKLVGQVMASPVVTVREDMHIVELVPLLSDRGFHHIPIVDSQDSLVGMVTQSDLVAALYAIPPKQNVALRGDD